METNNPIAKTLRTTGIRALLAATALTVLGGCADGPLGLQAIDSARYVGKPISVIYQKYRQEPYSVEQTADGKVYLWVEDQRYTYNRPTGSSRYGPTITYHYERAVAGSVSGYYYFTDRNGIIRDVKYRYLR